MERLNYKWFIDIAEKDLIASKLLFSNKLYMQSIFYLQQTIEKSSKGLWLMSGFVTYKEVTESGHNYFKLQRKIIQNKIEELKLILDNNNSYKFPFVEPMQLAYNGLYEYINNGNVEADLLFPLKVNVVQLLKQIGRELSYEVSLKISPDELIDNSIKYLEDYISELYNFYPVKKITLDKGMLYETLSSALDFYKSLHKVLMSLYLLNILFYDQVSRSRYPFLDEDYNPIKHYKIKNPLLKNYATIVSYIEQIITLIKKINKFNN